MSKFFVDPRDLVEVRDDDNPENVVVIRARMDRRTKAMVQREILQFQVSMDSGSSKSTATAMTSVEGQKLALLKNNVVKWRGPDFLDDKGQPVPCTPDFIDQLDPEVPLFDKVLREINDRNRSRQAEPFEEDGETVTDPNA